MVSPLKPTALAAGVGRTAGDQNEAVLPPLLRPAGALRGVPAVDTASAALLLATVAAASRSGRAEERVGNRRRHQQRRFLLRVIVFWCSIYILF